LADRTAFVVGDWTNAMTGRFDLIVCNPPYIPTAEVEFLMPEVSGHEPWRALDGGDDGYDAYRAILSKLRNHLGPRGVAVLELGYGQARYVVEHAHGAGFTASLRDDLAGIPRAVVLGWPYD
jgi:release factor glutamine methyltransferase